MDKPVRCAVMGQHPLRFPWGFDEEDASCAKMKMELAQQIMVLCVSGTDAPASSGAEDAALAYALAQKPLVLLPPTELTTMRIGWPFRTG